jgi:hypothetical protein
MFMGWPISVAFFSAALIMRRASSNFTAVIDPPLEVVSRLSVPSFRGGLFDQVCDFFRMGKLGTWLEATVIDVAFITAASAF